MNFLLDQIKEQKVLEMEVEIDQFIIDNKISSDSMIYKLEFDREVFAEEKEAREYLKDKFYYLENVILENEDSFIASIVSEHQIDSSSLIEIELRRGVRAYAGDLLPIMVEEMQFNSKGEVNLSTEFKDIHLSEGIPFIIEIARVASGEHPNYGKLNITQLHLESMEENFKSKVTGVDLAVNEDHKKNEAFGWFKDVFLSFDNQTLYGQIAWNPKGTQALSEKEYRYFSPEFRFNYSHPLTGKEHGTTLLGGALTNYPFLKMEPITNLNNKQETGEEIVKENTIELSVHNQTVLDLNTKLVEANVELNSAKKETEVANEKIKVLELSAKKIATETANQKLFDGGKINKAQLVALNEGKGMLEVLALSEKMNVEGAGVVAVDETIELSEADKKMAKSMGLTNEEFLNGNKTE